MKAAVLYGKELVKVEEVEPGAVQKGQVRLDIQAALTCGTDLKVFRRGYHARMIVPPALFGHELAGIVSEVGEGVTGWRLGDRVVVANSAPCEKCFYCDAGQHNLCDDLLFLNGAYAESIVVPERLVAKNMLALQTRTAFSDAALVEPLACVVQGIADTQLRPGERVLVIGAGPIGLMFVALSARLGCDVAVVGRQAGRLEAAARLGAAQIYDIGNKPDLVHAVKGQGQPRFDVVIEAVGKPETWTAAVALVRKGGRVNLFGGCPAGTSVPLDATLVHYGNLTLLASFHHTPASIRRALELIEQGVIRTSDFVDGECPLTQLPELLRSMSAGNRAVKTLVKVHE